MESITAVEWFMFGTCAIGLIYGHFVVKNLRKDNTFSQKK